MTHTGTEYDEAVRIYKTLKNCTNSAHLRIILIYFLLFYKSFKEFKFVRLQMCIFAYLSGFFTGGTNALDESNTNYFYPK